MEKPIVTAMTPDASTVGCRIKVTGGNFSEVTHATVGGVHCKVEDITPTSLIVVVASDARSGPVVVSNQGGAAGTQPLFTVTVEANPVKGPQVEHHERRAGLLPWKKRKKWS